VTAPILSWSSGKDSALALAALRAAGTEPAALLTTVTEEYERVSMHAVRRALLAAQAAAAGLPLIEVPIPPGCPNAEYEARFLAALDAPGVDPAAPVAFGDLFLADVRAYRERLLAPTGRPALFPLWGRDTAALAREAVDGGYAATVVCVDPARLDASFAGRRFDAAFLADLPAGVDPCGERGEFHTFVHAGPIFAAPIPCTTGEVVERDGFVFCDVLPGGSVRPPA